MQHPTNSSPSSDISVRVLLFAHLKDIAGADSLSMSVASGSTVHDILCDLERRFIGMAGFRESGAAAVNAVVVPLEHTLGPGDEIAFMPPVSGGLE